MLSDAQLKFRTILIITSFCFASIFVAGNNNAIMVQTSLSSITVNSNTTALNIYFETKYGINNTDSTLRAPFGTSHYTISSNTSTFLDTRIVMLTHTWNLTTPINALLSIYLNATNNATIALHIPTIVLYIPKVSEFSTKQSGVIITESSNCNHVYTSTFICTQKYTYFDILSFELHTETKRGPISVQSNNAKTSNIFAIFALLVFTKLIQLKRRSK